MKRPTHLFFYTLASIAFLNVFSHSFPSLPALYACMTIFSLLFGVSFLTAFRQDKSESFLRRMGSLEKNPRSSVFAQWSALPHRFSSVVFSAVRPGSYFMYSNLWIFEHLFCQPDPSISGRCVISFSV